MIAYSRLDMTERVTLEVVRGNQVRFLLKTEWVRFAMGVDVRRKWGYFIAKRGIKYTVKWLFSVPA